MEGTCRAYLARQDRQSGRPLDTTSRKRLAVEAGGADKILAYCQDLLPDDRKSKEEKQPPPDDRGQGGGRPPTPTVAAREGKPPPPASRSFR